MKWVIGSVSVILAAILGVYLYFCIQNYLYPLQYENYIKKYAEENSLPPELIASVINTESKFDATAVSYKGAIGLMQIMPETGQFIASILKVEFSEQDLFNPETNIKFGSFYLKYLKDKFISVNETVAAYNAGEGKVREWLASKNFSLDGHTLKSIPFAETNKYVEKINRNLKHYAKTFR